jgi:uncharacterized protein (TIGR03437 family)
VHFYIAGNAVNGNGAEDGGDHAYTNQYVLTPAPACIQSIPQINSVISAGAFGARTDFSPGTWLEIYGSNLAPTTKEWSGADFNGSNAPTTLDTVRVKINGADAFPRYVSPAQVNVQAPANAGTGPMGVVVESCSGASAPKSLTQVDASPGMLAPPSFIVGGKQMLVALTADASNYIGNIPGIPSRPAKPGEMILAYGIGFGPTSPPVAPGTIAGALNNIVAPLTVTIGGVQLPAASIIYAGLAPGYIGLYQFNLIVPSVPDGDQPVTIKAGSVTVPQTLFLSVKR